MYFCKAISPKESLVCHKENNKGNTLSFCVMNKSLLKEQASSSNENIVLVPWGVYRCES